MPSEDWQDGGEEDAGTHGLRNSLWPEFTALDPAMEHLQGPVECDCKVNVFMQMSTQDRATTIAELCYYPGPHTPTG